VVDPDIDLHVPVQRFELLGHPWEVLGVIAAGGVLGALARWGAGVAWPASRTGFPLTTFGVNALGCLAIGVLMVFVEDVFPTWRLLRPFVGVGILGGFTTFSAYAVDIVRLTDAGAAGVAAGYLVATVVVALLAVAAGYHGTRAAVRR
jgi:fluoride exporter